MKLPRCAELILLYCLKLIMNLGFADKKLVEPNVGVFTVHLNIRQGLMLNILNIMKESFLPYAPAMQTTVYFCAIQHHDSAK